MYENNIIQFIHNHPLDYNVYKGYIKNRNLEGDGVNLDKNLIEAKAPVNKIRELLNLKYDK